MPDDLPRRPPPTPRFRRWRQRRLAWRRRPRAPFASPDSWREGHDRRSRGHRYHAGLRRWPRRTLIGTAAFIVVLILLAIATVAYAFWRYHELDRAAVSNLAAVHAGSTFDILIVGSTPVTDGRSASRHEAKSLASVIMLARVDPKTHGIRLIAVPPETEIALAATGASTSVARPIADALETGPATLVQTVVASFHVPITDYLALKVSGIGSVVAALGGIHLDFAYPVRDAFTGLSINKTGCQLVSGPQTEALFQSRHFYYFANGAWRADLRGVASAIAREAAIFAATVTSTGGIEFDPVELNNLVTSVVANLTVDNALSESRLLSLAETFRGFSHTQLAAVTLPTLEATTRSGSTVVAPAPRPDDLLLARFLAFGTTSSPSSLLARVHVAVPAGFSVPKNARVVGSATHFAWDPEPC